MKKSPIFIILITIVIIALFFWHSHQPVKSNEQPLVTNSSVTQPAFASKTNSITLPKAKVAQLSPKPTNFDAIMRYIQKIKADPQYDWKQPINFYGRIVDENNVPVAGATAGFEWTDISPTGTSQDSAVSDSNGFFSLTNRKGKRLIVNVGKKGYYSSGNSRGAAFEYANPADGLFTPDLNNPIIFHLRKKGIGTDLISADLQIHIPRDGTPIKVDLLQQKVNDNGQIQFSESKPEFKSWKQATNWSFRMEIPAGGFVGENDEFEFTAPDEGYQSVLEFNFQQGQNWTTAINTNYYIKFGNPPLYGHLHIQTGISYGGAILTYAINPAGSRNLEPAQ